MSIVVYKCDTCKREVELIRNIHGLETIQRCTITHGCRGKLYQVDLLEDFSRATIPAEVDGLDDWIPRRVLYNHTQTIENSVWIINHDLGTYPAISVFADRPTSEDATNREEITPGDIQIVDSNTLLLRFDRPRSGLAQLVARSSDPLLFEPTTTTLASVVSTTAPYQLSASSIVVLAIRAKDTWTPTAVELKYSAASGTSVSVSYGLNSNAENTSWEGVSRVSIRGRVYNVMSFSANSGATISNGYTFRFSGFDFVGGLEIGTVVDEGDVGTGSPVNTLLDTGEVYVLLSNSPFDTIDRITDKLIDVTTVTSLQNQYAMYYDSGELFAAQSVASAMFPPIRTL